MCRVVVSLVLGLGLAFGTAVVAATLYLDGTLGADCTSGDYSIAARNCTGSDGDAYNTVQEVQDNSAANDTIDVRAGTYVLNVSGTLGIEPKNGQTWQAHTGESVTLDATGEDNAFRCGAVGIANITLAGFTIEGGMNHAIVLNDCGTGIIIENNDISGWHINDAPSLHAIVIRRTSNWTVRGNHIHSPFGGTFNDSCIASTSTGAPNTNNGGIVERNELEDCDTAIRTDVDDGVTTPHIWRYNIARDNSKHAFSVEARSRAEVTRNIAINSGEALRLRPGGAMTGIEMKHNTLYLWNFQGLRVNQQSVGNSFTNSLLRNNIFFSDNANEALLIEEAGTDASNDWEYNLYHVTHANNRAICWNEPLANAGFTCDVDGDTIRYLATSGDLAQFTTDTGEGTGQIVGDPLFVSAPTNFNLGAGSPAINAGRTGNDLGPFEPPIYFAAKTLDVDTWEVTFTSQFSPIQVASDCTGITPRVNGGARAASNCVVSGGVQLSFDVGGAVITAPDVLTVDLAQAAISDSIEVGGSLGVGPWNGENAAATGLVVTNELGGGSTFCALKMVDTAWRRFGVSGEGITAPRELIRGKKPGQDIVVPPEAKVQIRGSILCDDSGGGDPSESVAFRPFACDGTCGTPANWYELTSTFAGNLARLTTDATVTSPGVTTEQLNCGTFVAGVNVDATLGTFPTFTFADGECTELVAIIEIAETAVAGTDVVQVNFQQSDGTDLTSSVDATLYVGAPWAER